MANIDFNFNSTNELAAKIVLEEKDKEIILAAIANNKSMLSVDLSKKTNWWNILGVTIIIVQTVAISYLLWVL